MGRSGRVPLALWVLTASAPRLPRAFTALCYSADGQSVLAGGRSKFVCIYHVREQILRKRFEISGNLSLDAMEVSGRQGLSSVDPRLGAWGPLGRCPACSKGLVCVAASPPPKVSRGGGVLVTSRGRVAGVGRDRWQRRLPRGLRRRVRGSDRRGAGSGR